MTIQTLTGKTRIAGIFGWPVDHSRSPRLHGYWLKQAGIDGAYVPFATHPSKLEQGIRALPSLGFRGGNITLPHKERAVGFVDELTPVAKRIGAINMLVVRDDARIWHTTDRAELRMRAFSDDFLERYLDQAGEDVLHSVGAYRLEGLGAQLFERVTGDYFTILGLPLLPVLGILREHGMVTR